MIRRRPLSVASLALASLLATGVAHAQTPSAPTAPPSSAPAPTAPAPNTPKTDRGARTEQRFQQRLGLSDDQMKSVREIHQREAAAIRPLSQQLRDARAQLRQLAINGGDDAAIKAKSDEVAKLYAQTLEARTRALKEVSSVLTPEQRQKMTQMGTTGGNWHRRGPRPQPRSS